MLNFTPLDPNPDPGGKIYADPDPKHRDHRNAFRYRIKYSPRIKLPSRLRMNPCQLTNQSPVILLQVCRLCGRCGTSSPGTSWPTGGRAPTCWARPSSSPRYSRNPPLKVGRYLGTNCSVMACTKTAPKLENPRVSRGFSQCSVSWCIGIICW